ncbi:hypothetical protein FNF27_10052 (mitochondrion) [Cafeteria roenbergensis]|jgi:hypothetical protein|uniref:ATP synthase F0 subunit 8 n=1 Tax=Cafeteria roenbergensis TaxID=33653 RepID=Q9TAI0_CAFRO|nr:ATP synthase F0 subunit 8 [Cafeteria roenbergensis]AAF05806.1 ATP synthase F0 subunit 8 [Cafeteria roenbergensis]KAA0145457.1 hypothetical protein FNF29_10050 [Cafeteria roenbergensis]KAA0145491.1 hypothetical protein FNF28_10047 [Cafeteria roenbergensis]KAA0145529.1 hypothetical protein FNF31_10052 [Cafeteria roenbergensis]KAA0158047.1 hypothetical protein FNF27_10052 [Cafeteria roenbergensis]|eukprot:KAA0145457.1 hypothetical protein FNF29_10050 (mitochondrion) [Cafeteria roenbergensis]
MPQLDKELFTEYFFVIAVVLLSLHSDYYVSENFLRLNSQWFLHDFFTKSRLLLNYEKQEFTFYVDLLIDKSTAIFKK